MTEMLREVQAADLLGYQEMKDFRAALKAEHIPGPCRQLGVGKRRVNVWSRDVLAKWIANQGHATTKSMDDDIGALAR